MNITKVKILNNRTAIVKYEVDVHCATEKRTHEGVEKVTDEFYNAFKKSRETFVEYLSKLKNDVERIRTLEINLYYKAQELKQISYTVEYTPTNENNTTVQITTPKLPVWVEKPKAGTYYVSGKDLEIIHYIVMLAENYINGETKTKQMALNIEVA